MRTCSAPPRAGASTPGTTCSSSARWPTASPTASAPRARRSRSPPPARPAPPRSSSASRRSGAARSTAALCIGTDGSVNPESLIRFSLLSALSTQNDPPEAASKPFSKNRDGFVMGEGARRPRAGGRRGGARPRRQDPRLRARLRREGRRLPPHPLEPRRRARHRGDPRRPRRCRHGARRHRHRQRPRHLDAGERQDGGDGLRRRVRRAHPHPADLVQQVDDRPHADGRRRGRGGDLAPDHRARAHPADHQLRGARPRHPPRRRGRGPRRAGAPACCRTRSASAARTPASCWRTSRHDDGPEPGPGRRVLVTGGASGLGAAIVRALAAAGHDVAFTYRSSAEAAEALVAELSAAHPGRSISAQALDLADRAAVEAFCEDARGRRRLPRLRPQCRPVLRRAGGDAGPGPGRGGHAGELLVADAPRQVPGAGHDPRARGAHRRHRLGGGAAGQPRQRRLRRHQGRAHRLLPHSGDRDRPSAASPST